MFGTIRRHQQWIWFPIVVVTIIGFVWFFMPNGGGYTSGMGSQFAIINGKQATINGRPIPMDEYRSAHVEALLFHFVRNNGNWPEGDEATREALERDTVVRVFILQKLKELDISVSDEAVARLIRDRFGNYPPASLFSPHGVTLPEFESFMRHETAIQQLFGVVTSSAKLVKPDEAAILYRKEHEETAAELAIFWSSNYLDKVTVTPAAVAGFYTTNMANYRVPERVQVSYVEFAATNYLADAAKKLAEITNLTAQIDEAYYKGGTNLFKDTNGVTLPEAAAKAEIRQRFEHGQALLLARRQASDFGNELFSLPDPNQATNVEMKAAEKKLTVKVSAPFDRVGGLEDTNFPPEFREKALKLTKENPILFTPIVGDNAIYLIALKAKLPSEMPPLEKVQDKVTKDYKNRLAWELAHTAGTNFAASVTNGLAQKKPFAEICQKADVKPMVLPPFSPSTPSLTNLDERINFYMVRQMAFAFKPGEATPFYPLPRQEGGLLLYVRARVPVDEAKLKADMPEFMSRLRMYRQNENFNQWFNRQFMAKVFIPRKESPSLSPGS